MSINIKLLNELSNELEYKLRMYLGKNNSSEMYHIYKGREYEGTITFRNKSFLLNDCDSSINITALMLCYVGSGLGTKVLDTICKYGKELGAEQINIWTILDEITEEEDANGEKVTFDKELRIDIYKKIGKELGKKVSYDEENDRIIYKL